jgi:hypothetical protein
MMPSSSPVAKRVHSLAKEIILLIEDLTQEEIEPLMNKPVGN